jgi:hypothetical protein
MGFMVLGKAYADRELGGQSHGSPAVECRTNQTSLPTTIRKPRQKTGFYRFRWLGNSEVM